jgi:hypothetical protein
VRERKERKKGNFGGKEEGKICWKGEILKRRCRKRKNGRRNRRRGRKGKMLRKEGKNVKEGREGKEV